MTIGHPTKTGYYWIKFNRWIYKIDRNELKKAMSPIPEIGLYEVKDPIFKEERIKGRQCNDGIMKLWSTANDFPERVPQEDFIGYWEINIPKE